MFSYRHAFHAGNHADVLKHAILVHILEHMNQKPAPYWVVDTHAGAGGYDLRGDWSQKQAEYENGIARLYPSSQLPPQSSTGGMPDLIQRYVSAIQAFNTEGELRYYPGSPWLALQALREEDRLRLFELHPSEIEVLQKGIAHAFRGRGRQVSVKQMDGFDAVRAVLPPPTRRGVTVIDPSYEDKQDYRRVFSAVQEGLQRFATGCFAIWYPLVQRGGVASLTRNPERLDAVWVHATLKISKPAADGYGMHGSGMFVVNPPWTLHAALEESLPWLASKLGQDQHAGHTLRRSAKQ